jgi:hypothetical protein
VIDCTATPLGGDLSKIKDKSPDAASTAVIRADCGALLDSRQADLSDCPRFRGGDHQTLGEHARHRRHHLNANDLVSRTVPIVEDVQGYFYVLVYVSGGR